MGTIETVRDPKIGLESKTKDEVLLYLSSGSKYDPVRCIHNIILYGYTNKASDIHLDILDNYGIIKLRVNGHILYYAICEPLLFQGLLGVIKSRSNLRIDLHDRGQDGSFIFYPYRDRNDKKVFIRVAINPTLHGESVVMRLLDQESKGSNFKNSLKHLGMGDRLVATINKYTKLENSLVLISGSTGSGKTTTMYSIIQDLNPAENVIISLEDPVEKNIYNIRQIPIKPQSDFSYADALKMALRQDPDVIVIGEIRDRETALITIEAALTGHLIIAGIHARDPVDVVMRLTQLGVDYFLISQVLSLSIHQRMVYGENVNSGVKVDFQYVDFFSYFQKNLDIVGEGGDRLTTDQVQKMKAIIKKG